MNLNCKRKRGRFRFKDFGECQPLYSDGSPYEKRVDAKGRVLSDKCIADEVPFDIPESWEWIRIDTLFEMKAGKNIKAADISEEASNEAPYRCFGGNGIRGYVSCFNNEGDFPIIGRQGALCGNVQRATGRFYATEHAVVTTCPSEIDVTWACIFLKALNLNQYATATAQPGLAVSKIVQVLIPLPPMAEQRRIVDRVSELMPLVEEYGELEDAREALDSALPSRLRRSVLQEAVQGRLVPQDPADEPAAALLGRVRAERRRLVAEGKAKLPKGGESVIYLGSDGRRYEKRVDARGRESEPSCIDDEIPFDIPEGWEWARLESIVSLRSGLGYKKDNLSVKGNRMIRVLRGGNISDASSPVIKDNDVMISSEFVDDALILRNGQIITPAVTSLENVGKAALVRDSDGETVCGGFVFFLTPYTSLPEHSEYLLAYLSSPSHVAFCKGSVKKSGQAFYNLSKVALNSALVAIPPLAEQKRIVGVLNALRPQITNQ